MYDLLKSSKKMLLLVGATAIGLASLCVPAGAQDDDPPPQAGRIAYLTGAVSVQPAGTQDWGDAYPNLPLGPGDRLWTDANSRAEIQIGGTFVRLGPNTDFTLVDARQDGIYFGMGNGVLHVHTQGLWPGQSLYIQTPSGTETITQPSDLRVDVYGNDQTAIFTENAGPGYISGANGFGVELNQGQALELAGTNPVYPQWLEPNQPDDFDQWSRSRDALYERASAYRYVSPEMSGAYDLDAAGDWMPGTEYGTLWFPRVDADWQPYRNGHWVNRDPWGWVWVEDEPWGYAPFHFGRWINYRGRWGWVPGPRESHPVWSPALVVFAGGIQVGGGGVSAWFPLGPGEAFRPWYRCSPRYIDQVNITNISPAPRVQVHNTYVNIVNVNVTNITYVNRTNVVAVPQQAMAEGRPVRQAAVRVDAQQMQHMQVMQRPQVQPTRQAMIFRPVSRPVAAPAARPVMINAKGQAVAAQAHAQPAPPPVRQAPAPRQIQGFRPAAPPPNVKMTPQARQAMQNAPRPAPQQPGNQPRPGMQPPQQRPLPPQTRPATPAPEERPAAPAQQRPQERPLPPQPAAPRPATQQPESRPTNPQARPAEPQNRPEQQNRPAPQDRPAPQPRPDQKPAPAPQNRPAPQQPRPNARPEPQPRPEDRTAPPARDNQKQKDQKKKQDEKKEEDKKPQ